MSTLKGIGERIRLLREEVGCSQSELAEQMGVNRMTINNYENGKRSPDIAFAARVSDYFNVTLEYLTGRSEFRNREDMLDAVQKSNRLTEIIEETPQLEGQQLLLSLCQLLEASNKLEAGAPLLAGLISTLSEFNKLLASYAELDENIIRNVAELRWQKIQPVLIQWTCVEKTKALSESALSASNGISGALEVCAKALSQKLLKTLEEEAEK